MEGVDIERQRGTKPRLDQEEEVSSGFLKELQSE